MRVPVNKPRMTCLKLRKPYVTGLDAFFASLPYEVKEHWFCEGEGVTAKGLTARWAYENWLEKMQNSLWKRMLGYGKYRIPMKEAAFDTFGAVYRLPPEWSDRNQEPA